MSENEQKLGSKEDLEKELLELRKEFIVKNFIV